MHTLIHILSHTSSHTHPLTCALPNIHSLSYIQSHSLTNFLSHTHALTQARFTCTPATQSCSGEEIGFRELGRAPLDCPCGVGKRSGAQRVAPSSPPADPSRVTHPAYLLTPSGWPPPAHLLAPAPALLTLLHFLWRVDLRAAAAAGRPGWCWGGGKWGAVEKQGGRQLRAERRAGCLIRWASGRWASRALPRGAWEMWGRHGGHGRDVRELAQRLCGALVGRNSPRSTLFQPLPQEAQMDPSCLQLDKGSSEGAPAP